MDWLQAFPIARPVAANRRPSCHAAILQSTALAATRVVVHAGILIAGCAVISLPAAADGGSGPTTYIPGTTYRGPGPSGGADNATIAGGAGGNYNATLIFVDNVFPSPYAAGGGGAGYQQGGAGGSGIGSSDEGNGSIRGGSGGLAPNTPGQNGSDTGFAGSGGGGGTHGFVGNALNGGSTGTNGGNGGNGGNGSVARTFGGGGGAGGHGAVLTGTDRSIISNPVTGGNGGSGGNARSEEPRLVPGLGVGVRALELGGGGGSGGIGLLFTNSAGATVEINAAVKGGDGGAGGSGRGQFVYRGPTEHAFWSDAGYGIRGAGGVGVSGQNLNVVIGAGGSVAGGLGGTPPNQWPGRLTAAESGQTVRASAIRFTGGVNSLSIRDTTSITGQVNAFSQKDTLIWNSGNAASSFDLGLLGSQYLNFGHLKKDGAGTWTITGNWTSSADLNVAAGELALVGAKWQLGDNSINSSVISVGAGSNLVIPNKLTNNGLIRVEVGGTYSSRFNYGAGALINYGTIAGDLENSGGLFNEASGKVAGNVTNIANLTRNKGTISGNVTIIGGTVQVDDAGKIGGGVQLVNSGTTLDISHTDAGLTIRTLEGVANSQVALGAQTLTIAQGATAYAGVVQGDGNLTIAGGTQVLSGIQTYTGSTTINAGKLVVNGSIASSSAVTVNPDGALGGNGTFGNVINNGGTVSPGNSIGVIHVNGNLNMSPSSKYYVEINGSTSDIVTVAGSANIQSSVFEIAHDSNTAAAPVLPGKTYTILTTGGGLANTTPAVGIADFPFLNFKLNGDGFNAYLTTSRGAGAFAELATTPNQKAVADALDTMAASNPLWQQVVGATEAGARAAFTSLSNASIHANAASVLSDQSHYIRDAVTDRLRQDFAYGTGSAAMDGILALAPVTPSNAYAAFPSDSAPMSVATRSLTQVYAVWAQALGSRGSLKGDGNAAQTNQSLGGVISGIDLTFNETWRVGLAGGYSQSIFKSQGVAASGSSDNYHIALYGGGQAAAWGVRGGASFSWSDLATSRQVNVINISGTQRGDYAATTAQVFGEIGHRFRFEGSAFEPFAAIAYVHVDGTVKETGNAAVFGSTGLDTTYATLGLRGAAPLTSKLTARGTLGWRHAFGDVTSLATLAFRSGGAAFTLAGVPIARDALVADAGLDLALAPNATLGLSWTGQFARQSRDNAVKGDFVWRF